MHWLRRFSLLALAIPCVASASVIDGVVTEGAPPAPPPDPPAIARSTAAVFINFDDATEPCGFLSTTALRTKYAALGVTFTGPGPLDGGGILNECGNFGVAGHSPPNFLAFNSAAHFSDTGIPRDPQQMHFSSPVSQVSILAATGSDWVGPVAMRAYDAGNVLLSGHSFMLQPTVQLLTVSAAGIVRVEVDGPAVFILDDLAFDFAVVPTVGATWGRLKTIYR